MSKTVTVSEARNTLFQLCRGRQPVVICNRDKPVRILLAIEDYGAMLETMELLANPRAM